MGLIVIVAYRPKPGRSAELQALLKAHVSTLQREGLATERTPMTMLAKDGTMVEVFEWASKESIDAAHSNPTVNQMWSEFAAVCDYVPIANVVGAEVIFSEFAPLD